MNHTSLHGLEVIESQVLSLGFINSIIEISWNPWETTWETSNTIFQRSNNVEDIGAL